MSSIHQILRRAQPGSSGAVRDHIRRGERIAAAIAERWGADHPHHWRLKHVRWYLECSSHQLSPATRYDHWRTVRALLAALGRLPDWEPRLRGPWRRRDGVSRPRGRGGRPAKLANRARGG